jgi:glycosyltransferase, family 1
MMKVLLQSYNTCCQNRSGGVNVRIKKIYQLLKDLGVKVHFFDKFSTDLNEYDVLHVFRLDAENTALIECAKQRGLKVVISSIVNLDGGRKIDIYRKIINKLPVMTTYKLMFQSLKLADSIIVETPSEKVFLHKHYGVDTTKISVIPNGVEEITYNGKDIFSILKSDKKFLLHVGRFDKNKNQLNVIKALKDTDIDLVFIGGADHTNSSYYDECKLLAEGSSNIHFLGWLDSSEPLFKSALSNAYAFILPSFHETFGLVLLEAGVCGALLLISNTLPILKFSEFNECYTFSPSKPREIRNCVMKVWSIKEAVNVKDKIIKKFSWNTIISEHIDLYNKLGKKNYQ